MLALRPELQVLLQLRTQLRTSARQRHLSSKIFCPESLPTCWVAQGVIGAELGIGHAIGHQQQNRACRHTVETQAPVDCAPRIVTRELLREKKPRLAGILTAVRLTQQMEQPELLGRWQATLAGQTQPTTLQLGPHPEWNGTVKGTITRPAGRSIVVGDVNQGKLTMEESADGKKVSGTWLGDVVDGSCAREIRGEWLDDKDNSTPFVMRKQSQ